LSSGSVPASFGTDYTSHNTYLTILVEIGGVGLALLLIPAAIITWQALKMALASPELRWFVVGAIAALGVYVFTASSIDMRFFSFVPALTWLLLGILRRSQLSGALLRYA
jgi:O-antigen ligase